MGLAKMSQKVGSNGSGSWQKDVSQNIVKGRVFLGPAATVHWHFYKKDCGATAKDRGGKESGGGEKREKDSDRRGSACNNKLSLREPLVLDNQWQRHEHSMRSSEN